jgi:hypothetical protein
MGRDWRLVEQADLAMRKLRPRSKKWLAEKFYTHPTSRPASETPEGRKHERAYWVALGRFVAMFSKVETAITLTLWHYAKTPQNIARVVFPGVRIDQGSTLIKALAKATDAEEAAQTELEYVLQQLGIINGVRNDTLHYGAMSVAEGRALVTNALKAKTPDAITAFPISPESLADMTADLRKVIVHLHAHHMGRPHPRGAAAFAILQAPWRYKHPVQKKSKSKTG